MKQEIEIEDLPEGMTVTKVKITSSTDRISPVCAMVYMEKAKPRRIVLEETEEDNDLGQFVLYMDKDVRIECKGKKIWRIKE